MSTITLEDAAVWLGGFDLTADMNAVEIGASADVKDDTTMGANTRRNKAGLKVARISLAGLWEGGASAVDDVLFGKIAVADQLLSIGLPTGAAGEFAYMLRATLAEYTPGGSVGEILAFRVTAEANEGDLYRGQVLHNAARTTTANGTAYELGAVSATQAVFAGLHVLAVSGTDTPTLTVKLQSDALEAFGSSADQLTFTAATAVGAQFKTLAGANADTWWRAQWTISGTNPSFTFVLIVLIQ